MTPFLRRSLSSTLSAWGLALLTASGCGAPAPAGDRDPAPVTVRRGAATAGPRTSPFEPQKESDRNFVTDAGSKLDTGCIYRSSGPIEFDIDVTRYLGPLKADGTLANADALINGRVAGADGDAEHARLRRRFGRRADAGRSAGARPGLVQRRGDRVPLRRDRHLEAELVSDRHPQGPIRGPRQRRVVARARQEPRHHRHRRRQRRAGLVHLDRLGRAHVPGHLTDHPGARQQLGRRVLRASGIHPRPGPPRPARRQLDQHADRHGRQPRLAAQYEIPAIAKSFGATGIHLVAHSKGGLDVREYLAQYQPSHDKEFKVLSYTTLSTPHNGSALADC